MALLGKLWEVLLGTLCMAAVVGAFMGVCWIFGHVVSFFGATLPPNEDGSAVPMLAVGVTWGMLFVYGAFGLYGIFLFIRWLITTWRNCASR